MNLKIRKAVIDDLEKIQELNYKLFDLEYKKFDPTLNMEWTYSEKGKQYFQKTIENGTVWVATDNSKIIGYLAGHICGVLSYTTRSFAELDNFFIEEEYRGKGIGRKLVSEFKKYCADNNIDEIKVTASALNAGARKFYEAVGFHEFDITYKTEVIKDHK